VRLPWSGSAAGDAEQSILFEKKANIQFHHSAFRFFEDRRHVFAKTRRLARLRIDFEARNPNRAK
jgi:hypothetical protein